MMTRCRPCSAASRRHFARISSTPIDGVSSMKIFASLSVPIACDSRPQSRSPRNPPRSRCASMRASAVSMRRNSCSFDISRLNTPTVMSVLVPTCCAMFSTRLVFPIDGRAAMMIRSDGCRPDVISSRSVKPVGTPVISSLRACSFSMVSRLRLRQVAQRHEAVADLVVGDREDGVLGLIEDDVGVLLGLVGRRRGSCWPRRSGCRRVAFSLMIRA